MLTFIVNQSKQSSGVLQEFVASTGLMEHLVNEILKGGFRCATSLQVSRFEDFAVQMDFAAYHHKCCMSNQK